MRKHSKHFHDKRASGRTCYGEAIDMCAFTHSIVNSKQNQFAANTLLQGLLKRGGVA